MSVDYANDGVCERQAKFGFCFKMQRKIQATCEKKRIFRINLAQKRKINV